MPSTMFIKSPIGLFINCSASQPAIPPMMMAAIQPIWCSSIGDSLLAGWPSIQAYYWSASAQRPRTPDDRRDPLSGQAEERSELAQRRLDIRATRCLYMGAMMVMETDREKAQHAWDYRWCRVTDCGALLAAMVARKECGANA